MATFAFGKHKGRSFDDIARREPGYCEWALREPNPSRGLQEFIRFLHAHGSGFTRSAASGISSRGLSRSQGHLHVEQGQAGTSQLMQPSSSPGACLPTLGQLAGQQAPCRQRVARQPRAPRVPRKERRHRPSREAETTSRQMPENATSRATGLRQVVLVCQLSSASKFTINAEHWRRKGRLVCMPRHISRNICKWKGARLLPDKISWELSLDSLSGLVDELRHNVQVSNVETIPAWVLTWLQHECIRQPVEPCLLVPLPDEMLPYQQEGVFFGLRRGGRCLIGDEMGLGKTLQGLALASQYPNDWPVLVVCPAPLRWVWKEQALEWFPDLFDDSSVQVLKTGSDKLNGKASLVIVSYNLCQSTPAFRQRSDGGQYQIVICDESHCCKDWDTKRTQAVVPLLKQATRAILLSGTPIRNNSAELHPQLSGLVRNFCNLEEFKARYCIESGKSKKIAGARNQMELNVLLTSTVMIRRDKKSVLQQLPPKRRQKIPLELENKQALKEIQDLMQGSDDIEAGGEKVLKVFQLTAEVKLASVKEYLSEILQSSRDKFIVFAHHRFFLDSLEQVIQQGLVAEKCEHIRIDGQVPMETRSQLVKKFQEDEHCRVAILSITACSEGISLTAASRVVFAELYWVPGVIEQAEARAHRIGTASAVLVDFLVVAGTADESVYKILQRKKKDTSFVLDGAASGMGALERVFRKRLPASDLQEMRCAAKHARASCGADAAPGKGVPVNKASRAKGGTPLALTAEEPQTKTDASMRWPKQAYHVDAEESSSDESSSESSSGSSSEYSSSSSVIAPPCSGDNNSELERRANPLEANSHSVVSEKQPPVTADILPVSTTPSVISPPCSGDNQSQLEKRPAPLEARSHSVVSEKQPPVAGDILPVSTSPSVIAPPCSRDNNSQLEQIADPLEARSHSVASEKQSPVTADILPVSTTPSVIAPPCSGDNQSQLEKRTDPLEAHSHSVLSEKQPPVAGDIVPVSTTLATGMPHLASVQLNSKSLLLPQTKVDNPCLHCGKMVVCGQEPLQCPACRGRKRKHREDTTCRKGRCQCAVPRLD